MWDLAKGGSPTEPVFAELRAMGRETWQPPSAWALSQDGLRGLWVGAGLERVETRVIHAQRNFDSAADYWRITSATGFVRAALGRLDMIAAETLQERVLTRLSPAGTRPITVTAFANAVQGRVPE